MPNDYSRQWFDVFLDTMPSDWTAGEVGGVCRRLPLPAFRRVLDICCGPGRHAGLMAGEGYEITGVDRDAEAIEQARATIPAGTFVEIDQRDLRHLDGPFDATLILWQSFGYFDPAANDQVLADIGGVLRPGGRLLLDLFHPGYFEAHQGRTTEVRDSRCAAITNTLDGSQTDLRHRVRRREPGVDELGALHPGRHLDVAPPGWASRRSSAARGGTGHGPRAPPSNDSRWSWSGPDRPDRAGSSAPPSDRPSATHGDGGTRRRSTGSPTGIPTGSVTGTGSSATTRATSSRRPSRVPGCWTSHADTAGHPAALARLGADVLGVDVSAELVARARSIEDEHPLGVAYRVADVARPDQWWDGVAFDGATCEMAMMDIDDLTGTVDAVATTVRPGGWFAISMVHPCFPGNEAGLSSWPPDRPYSHEGWWTSPDHNPDGARIRVGSSHRTLSTYLNAFIAAGFALERATEPPAPVPTILLLRCRLS